MAGIRRFSHTVAAATAAVVAVSMPAAPVAATFVAEPCHRPIDLVLALDNSGSITDDDRNVVLQFARNIVSAHTVSQGPGNTRVGVVEYAKFLAPRMQLNEAVSNAAVNDALSLPRDANILRQTDTPRVLNYIRETMFLPENGARTLPEFARFVVLVTDGRSTRDGGVTDLTDESAAAAQALRNAGATVIAVGVGNAYGPELLAIAGSEGNRFQVSSMGYLNSLSSQIGATLCPGCAAKVDLTFIIDSSGSITDDARNSIMAWARAVASNYDVSLGESATRVAVLEYASLVLPRLLLSDATSNSAVDAALSQPRDFTIRRQTNTPAALMYAKDVIFAAGNGARMDSDVRRIAIVVTDGQSTLDGGNTWLTAETNDAAQSLWDAGVTTIAVGIGRSTDSDKIWAIAGDDSRVFTVQRAQWIRNTLAGIMQAACPATEAEEEEAPEAAVVGTAGGTVAATSGVAVIALVVAVLAIVVAVAALRPKYSTGVVVDADNASIAPIEEREEEEVAADLQWDNEMLENSTDA